MKTIIAKLCIKSKYQLQPLVTKPCYSEQLELKYSELIVALNKLANFWYPPNKQQQLVLFGSFLLRLLNQHPNPVNQIELFVRPAISKK